MHSIYHMKTLINLAAGIAGGIAGTFLMQQAMKLGGKLPQRFQPRMKGSPPDAVLDKTEDLLGRELPDQLREQAKPVLQYVYGMTGPLVLGLTAHRLGKGSIGRTLAAGAAMGAIVWAVGYLGWMPMAGVTEPVHRQRVEATANAVLSHAAYGLVSALPVALAERFLS